MQLMEIRKGFVSAQCIEWAWLSFQIEVQLARGTSAAPSPKVVDRLVQAASVSHDIHRRLNGAR
jgi:hypothetical protein